MSGRQPNATTVREPRNQCGSSYDSSGPFPGTMNSDELWDAVFGNEEGQLEPAVSQPALCGYRPAAHKSKASTGLAFAGHPLREVHVAATPSAAYEPLRPTNGVEQRVLLEWNERWTLSSYSVGEWRQWANDLAVSEEHLLNGVLCPLREYCKQRLHISRRKRTVMTMALSPAQQRQLLDAFYWWRTERRLPMLAVLIYYATAGWEVKTSFNST